MLKLIIADDSLIFRNLLKMSLRDLSYIDVISEVRCGSYALDSTKKLNPDLLLLDHEMPDLNGFEVLAEIQSYKMRNNLKTEVIVLSGSLSVSESEYISKGAMAFIRKPTENSLQKNELLLRTSIEKVIKKKLGAAQKNSPSVTDIGETSEYDAIVIGSSTGGPRVLSRILPSICSFTSIPIFIAQHMQKDFTANFASTLSLKCKREVLEVNDRSIVECNGIYLAAGGRHITVKRGGGSVLVTPDDEAPVNGHRPSVDVMFKSVANIYSGAVLAIMLSGMGNDGANGSEFLKKSGATIIAQDKESSAVWGMPKAAIDRGIVDFVLSPDEIVEKVKFILRGC